MEIAQKKIVKLFLCPCVVWISHLGSGQPFMHVVLFLVPLCLQEPHTVPQPGQTVSRTILNVFGPMGHGGRHILDNLKVRWQSLLNAPCRPGHIDMCLNMQCMYRFLGGDTVGACVRACLNTGLPSSTSYY